MDTDTKQQDRHLNWLNSLAAATFVIDNQRRIIFWNHACELMTGVRSEEVIGTNKHWSGFYQSERPCLADLVLDDDWERNVSLYSHIQRASNSARGLLAGNWCQTPVGEKYLIFEANALFDSEGNMEGAIETLRDASDLKQMEVELRLAQKLEAVGQLAAGIAHEINTPAQYVSDNIRFFSEGLTNLTRLLSEYNALLAANVNGTVTADLIEQLKETIEATDIDYYLEEIPSAIRQSQNGMESITNIVRAMKEFSHPGSDEKSLVDINHIIENTATVTRNEWKYIAEMILELDDQLPPVPCYPQQMGQVFMNLIVNAVHAITDVVDKNANELGSIRISSKKRDGVVEISVIDSGKGVPKNIIDKIFDPFFTTKGVGKGTGQGLAIAQSAIKDKHGGVLKCESAEGIGTTFIIQLPLAN